MKENKMEEKKQCKKGECENKNEKGCKQKEIDSLKAELDVALKTIEEQKSTINNYLATASYYKNELDSQKKDFDRYKERNKNFEREASQKANEDFAKKLMPVLDNFDQAMAHIEPEVMKGFAMIYSSLLNVLTDIGIVEIQAKGLDLNPELHNCISTEEATDEALDGVVATVYQKGYMFAETGKVVRPSTVSVYKIN
ncbi:MAG: nucleotide exchange factor GrpE [Clostridiales bacterium]|nr:nucleotide exchange factor GrpE [Clostridiales bacterium]